MANETDQQWESRQVAIAARESGLNTFAFETDDSEIESFDASEVFGSETMRDFELEAFREQWLD